MPELPPAAEVKQRLLDQLSRWVHAGRSHERFTPVHALMRVYEDLAQEFVTFEYQQALGLDALQTEQLRAYVTQVFQQGLR